ncbi:MAG: caspase family protein, partial [Thermotogae bacterium]|nr:caspase family protein [Thermotogota bacterium]
MIALIKRVALILMIILATISFASVKALIVYVSEYKDPGIIPLPFAKKDAMNMKTAIQSIPGAMVKVVENPGYDDFAREFKRWARSAEEGETLIFYYAGHGISHEGQFYFIPSGADPEDEFTWIPFSRLKKYIPSEVRMVWLIDACYSGSIVKGRPLKALRVEKEALSAGKGQVIITSSTGNEISREMPDGSGGIFTVTLVEGLKGAADEDGDGWIESGELHKYVEKKVEELSGGQQHPMMKGQGDIKIVENISGKLKELDKKLFDLY